MNANVDEINFLLIKAELLGNLKLLRSNKGMRVPQFLRIAKEACESSQLKMSFVVSEDEFRLRSYFPFAPLSSRFTIHYPRNSEIISFLRAVSRS